MNAIEVEKLTKRYPGVLAVDDLSFTVPEGEIFGLLGPNGAGKSTTLSILEGLLAADAGRVTVLGHDVAREATAVKRRIGVQLQATSLLPDMTALEQVRLFGRLYGHDHGREHALNLLKQVGLTEKAHAQPSNLSGGQQQRLALAIALVNDPGIIFLDEPTAGLDPQARRMVWDLVRQFQAQGRTIVLTTHYMEEAEMLCHRVGIIDHGRLLALDTPGGLINQLADKATITVSGPWATEEVANLAATTAVQAEGHLWRLQTTAVAATTRALLDLADRYQYPLRDLHIQQPSLEDVFLHLTGRLIRE